MRQVVTSRKAKLGITGLAFLFFVTLMYSWMSEGEILRAEETKWLVEEPIAHRGLHSMEYPENSLGAFKRAINREYNIELDIQVTKDKQVVVFHDSELERMTGVEGKINQWTYEEVQELFLADTDEKIPLLGDVLALIDGQVGVIVEIKYGLEGRKYARAVDQVIEGYEGNLAIQSFDPFILHWFEEESPEILRGQVAGEIPDAEGELEKVVSIALENMMANFIGSPNFIAYDAEKLPHFRVQSLRNHGMPILAWTVDCEEKEKTAAEYADNIIFE